jgi:dihydrofolate reductase
MNMDVVVPISLIVACDTKGGIAKDGQIPWHYPQELTYFSKTTTKTKDPTKINAIIMGRKTWDSLPRKPLPHRVNIIISRYKNTDGSPNEIWVQSIAEAIEYVKSNSQIEDVYVIGGESIYSYVINNHYSHIQRLYYTEIHNDFQCDQFFPIELFENQPQFTKSVTTNSFPEFTYHVYENKNLQKYI